MGTRALLLAVYLAIPRWGQNGTTAGGAKRDYVPFCPAS